MRGKKEREPYFDRRSFFSQTPERTPGRSRVATNLRLAITWPTRGDELQTLTINTASANITITRQRRTVDKLAVDTAKAIHTIFSE